MASCDNLRDETLVDLGIRLEDRSNAKAVWKPDDPAVLRQEVEERKQQQLDAARKKKENLLKTKASQQSLESTASFSFPSTIPWERRWW